MKNIYRIFATCLGLCIWYITSQSRYETITLNIPLCFYPDQLVNTLQAPDTITVTLAGTRSHLKQLEYNKLAAHIDVRFLDPQKPWIAVEAKHLFLPGNIKMVHSTPSPVPVHVNKANNNLLPQGA